jgi:toxin CcdB
MGQWDVHHNPVQRARDEIPYLVVLQSHLLDDLPTRLVAPLSRSSVLAPALPQRLVPRFEVAGEWLALKPHEAGVIDQRMLGRPVASLREHSHRIIDALDTVISGV